MADSERLQTTLDDIAGTVEWASEWIEELEDEAFRGDAGSDLPILVAQGKRLRAVADAVLPNRVRDPVTGRRWYLAPDDALQRTRDVDSAIDKSDADLARAATQLAAKRKEADRLEAEREIDQRQRHERDAARQTAVSGFLREHGPATASEIAHATGLDTFIAEIAARQVAKRGRDKRFRIDEGG